MLDTLQRTQPKQLISRKTYKICYAERFGRDTRRMNPYESERFYILAQ